jgi:hypothetical protein
MRRSLAAFAAITLDVFVDRAIGRSGARGRERRAAYVLRPARVFDGESMHDGWVVVVRGSRIEAAGSAASVTVPPGAEPIESPECDAHARMIEAHSHVLLHAYNEAPGTIRC